ncbi:hypothetical protein [Streptomyces sp. Ac-502]|uniref:hypothetical protein n=1 Tax=Streptomyces sp. Ac-502 TaxID=3342801 RepID=UPI0038628289
MARAPPLARTQDRPPAAGTMDLAYDDFALPGDPHVTITTCAADPGTPGADALTLPATWADTQKQPRTVSDDVRRMRPRHPQVRDLRDLPGRSPTGGRGTSAPGQHLHVAPVAVHLDPVR